MIHHIIRFHLKPHVTEEQTTALLDSLRAQASIPGVRHVFVGRAHGEDSAWGANFVLDDLESYWTFITHPSHLETDRLGWPLLEDFSMVDLTDDLDPGLGEKISALHARRLEEIPELSDLVGTPDQGEQAR